MFSMRPSKPHSERKRMLAHVYSNSYIPNSVDLKQILHAKISEKYLPQMRKLAEERRPIYIYTGGKKPFLWML